MDIQYTYPNSTENLTQKAQKDEQICHDAAANGGLSFKDALDCVNPLQQLPIVGSIYRAVTGDTISTPARVVGGAIFGGPIGMLGGMINSALENITGGDIGEHVASIFGGSDSQKASAAYSQAQKLGS